MFSWLLRQQVYHPSKNLFAFPSAEEYVDLRLPAGPKVELHGWYFPAPTPNPSNQVVLICHGNAGNISHRLDLCQLLVKANLSACVFDYQGYGRSTGRPSENGTYHDAEIFYHWLRQRGYHPSQILLWGESLGTAVAVELALRQPVAGLILQSPFTSVADVAKDLIPWLPARWLLNIRYDTLAKAPRLDVPVLVLHSRADSIIPFAHAERLFSALPSPKLFVELKADHNDVMLTDTAILHEAIATFLPMVKTNHTRLKKPS